MMENLRVALPLQLHCTQYYPYIDDDCVYVVWLLSFKNHPPTIGWNDNNKKSIFTTCPIKSAYRLYQLKDKHTHMAELKINREWVYKIVAKV